VRSSFSTAASNQHIRCQSGQISTKQCELPPKQCRQNFASLQKFRANPPMVLKSRQNRSILEPNNSRLLKSSFSFLLKHGFSEGVYAKQNVGGVEHTQEGELAVGGNANIQP
jgi:hypothetical protein